MWIFTRHGFYSVTKAPGKPGKMQIRARRRLDLERLNEEWLNYRRRFQLSGKAAAIIETPEADYRWRVVVSWAKWIRLSEMLAENIDYENFKNAAHDDAGGRAPLLQIWAMMHRYQEEARGPIDDSTEKFDWYDELEDRAHPAPSEFNPFS